MEITDSNNFFKIISSFKIIPYSQTFGYYKSLSIGIKRDIQFFVNNIENPSIACFGFIKNLLGKKYLQLEGECYKNDEYINTKNIREFYTSLSNGGYDIIELSSNATYSFDFETGLRQAGFLRPVGQFSMPVTKIIYLNKPISYNQNWKRNLKKAQQNELFFHEADYQNTVSYSDFILIYNGMQSRKQLGHHLSDKQVEALCTKKEFRLFFVEFEHKNIAAIVIHHIGNHAGLFYAATNDIALETSASFFMYEKLFETLISEGVETFDMEKLVPSTAAVNQVFNFKNGINGQHVILNGEWSWYKKQYYRPMMYFMKKFMLKKREL